MIKIEFFSFYVPPASILLAQFFLRGLTREHQAHRLFSFSLQSISLQCPFYLHLLILLFWVLGLYVLGALALPSGIAVGLLQSLLEVRIVGRPLRRCG